MQLFALNQILPIHFKHTQVPPIPKWYKTNKIEIPSSFSYY